MTRATMRGAGNDERQFQDQRLRRSSCSRAGQDSSVCLAWALDRYARVETIGFDYGQRHLVEMQQRPKLLAAIPALKPAWTGRLGPDHVLRLETLGRISETSLTRRNGL